MKICILTERMRIGFGVDAVVDEQAIRLARRGYEVVVVVIHADLIQPAREYELIVLNKIMKVEGYGSADLMQRILTQARVGDVDIWMIHTPPFYDWLVWLDGPVVLMEHGTPPGHFFIPEIGKQLEQSAKQRVEVLFGKLQPFDAIISISHSIHQWLPPKAQGSSSVIYHGGDHFPEAHREKAESLRSSLGVETHECLILWVGRMQLQNDEQPYKGFRELFDLMPAIQARVSNTKFLLVGRVSDADRRTLEARGIAILANRTAEEMAQAYAAADILLNLSKWEGFNLALLEAQFQGTPVVAYDFGPHSEVVRHGETGLLAKTSAELLDAVVTLAADPSMRAQFGERARSFARTLTWDRNVDETIALIEAKVAQSPTRSEISALRRNTMLSPAPSPMPLPAPPQNFDEKLSRVRRQASSAVDRWAPFLRPEEDRPQIVATGNWLLLPGDEFVRMAFRVLLGREAEPQMVAASSAEIAAGRSRSDILTQIRFSEEGRNRRLTDPDLLEVYPENRRPFAKRLARRAARPAMNGRIDDLFHHISRIVGANQAKVGAQTEAILDRLAAIEAKLETIHSIVPSLQPPIEQPKPTVCDVAGSALGSNHVVVIAPGAVLEPMALQRLAQAASSSDSDIVFGDEYEWAADTQSRRVRAHGPFREHAFLRSPNLGGAIAVRRSLLDRLDMPTTVILTGSNLLRLVSDAHSLTYIPLILTRRTMKEIASHQPQPEEIALYSQQAGRNLNDTIAPVVSLQPDIRFPRQTFTKAAIVVSSTGMPKGNAQSAIEHYTPADSYCLIDVDAMSDRTQSQSPSAYGKQLNEAIRNAPDECDLIVVMDSSVAPTHLDWLKRLSQSTSQPGIGIVAPKTLYRNGRIRHAGMAFGLGEPCSYISRFAGPADETSTLQMFDRTSELSEVSVVSHHCMIIRRAIFRELEGFDERLRPATVDVDLCLRVRSLGLRVMLDGRIVMTSDGETHRWARTFEAADVLALLARHPGWLTEPDPFWVERTAAGDAVSGKIRTVFKVPDSLRPSPATNA